MGKKNTIASIEPEIVTVQIEEYLKGRTKKFYRNFWRDFAKFFALSLLFIDSLVVDTTFGNPFLVFLFLLIPSGIVAKNVIKKVVWAKRKENALYGQARDSEELFALMEKEEAVIRYHADDFLQPQYKKYQAERCNESLDEQKYNRALERQLAKREKDDDYVWELDDSLAQLIDDLDNYKAIYTLPTIDISDADWDIFFNHLYQYYCAADMQEDFYPAIAGYVRYLLAKALIEQKEYLTIDDFIDNMLYFTVKENYPVINHNPFERHYVRQVQAVLRSQVTHSPIIDFKAYQQQLKKW